MLIFFLEGGGRGRGLIKGSNFVSSIQGLFSGWSYPRTEACFRSSFVLHSRNTQRLIDVFVFCSIEQIVDQLPKELKSIKEPQTSFWVGHVQVDEARGNDDAATSAAERNDRH